MIQDKIKSLRKQAKLSQEEMAAKLNVSRQAVTKWETGAGLPDIENLVAISQLFQVSVDELLDNEQNAVQTQDFLFESKTEYDIDGKKKYDINFAGAKSVSMCGYSGEKIQLRLASNQISDIQSSFKVKLDDIKHKIDVDVKQMGNMYETVAKSALHIFIYVPLKYAGHIELSGNSALLEANDINVEGIEFSGKIERVNLNNISSNVEIDSNSDMEIYCTNAKGSLSINQINSTSSLYIEKNAEFTAVKKGIGNHILFKQPEIQPADFGTAKTSENGLLVELNGMKSELSISMKEEG